MNFQFVFAVILVLAAKENGCLAGKGFGGGFGFDFSNVMLMRQQKMELLRTQADITVAQDAANATIQADIAAAKNVIDNAVAAAQVKALAVPANCANGLTAALGQVNSKSVDLCDQAAQFDAIDFQKKQLWGQHAFNGAMFKACKPSALNPSLPDTCVEDHFAETGKQVTDQKNAILANIDNAVLSATACIDNASKQANDAIVNANAAFDSCVKAAE